MDEKQRRPMDLFSTAAVDSDEAREVLWFCYCVGQSVPGEKDVRASREETNLNVANMLVDRRQLLRTCAIRIPAVSPAVFQRTGTPYAVTPDDVAEFCRHAVVSLMIGGEVPWVEFTPKTTRIFEPATVAEIERGEKSLSGSFSEEQWPASDEGMRPVLVRGQEKPFCFERGVALPRTLIVNRIEKFWAQLAWLNGPPTFGAHPDDSSVRGRVAVEFWMIGDEALPSDCDEAYARVVGK